MIKVTYYYKVQDDPDGKIRQHLEDLSHQLDFTFIDICLDENPDLINRLQDDSASLQIGPYRLHAPFNDVDIQVAIRSFEERFSSNDENSIESVEKKTKPVHISASERFSYWLSNNYVWVFSVFLVLFVGLPLLAPVLMKTNHKGPAKVIYSIYSVVCHQLAFRSFYFYGEQAYYPRELAHIPGVLTYEQITGNSADDIEFARQFVGDDLLGYKVAICERDIAIYGSLLLASLLFQLTGKKWKPLPWYWWLIIAIIPIGLDGGSQLFSFTGTWPSWLPVRESTPFLRVLTGTLFGIFTAWYLYPMMEESMKDVRTGLARKIAIKKKLIQKEVHS